MSALSIQPTYPIFTDIDGQPLEDGYVWIGTANLDPQTNPINVYWDAALTLPAAQPIRTLAGYPANSGTPARLYVNSDYSIRVMNKNGSAVYSAPAATERYSNVVVSGVNAENVVYDPPFNGGIQTNVESKLAQYVSVFDFMTASEIAGVQSGAQPDVTHAIQAAILAGRVIYFPPGQYKISSTIDWENQWLVGALDNGALSTATNQTMIIADGTFPAFRYFNPNGFNAHGGGIKNFNIFFADGAEPATVTTRPNAIGIFIGPSDGYPAFHTFENITVRGGQWGVFDDSGSWMAIYDHIQTHDCIGGIYKKGGTTHTLNACYHRNGKAGFHFTDVLGVALNACAVDLCDTDVPGYFPVFVENSTVTFNGCDFEGIKLNGDYREIVRSNGQQALVQLNACRFFATEVTAATETYMVRATSGGKIQLNGVDFIPTSYTGSGGVFAYLVAIGNGTVSATDTLMPALTGSTPASAYLGLATTAGVVDINNCVSPYPLFGAAYRMDKSIRFSVAHDFASIPANSSVTNVFTVTGAAVGDFVMVSLETNVTGVVFNAWVSATDTVTVDVYNQTGAPIDLPNALLRIGVIQK